MRGLRQGVALSCVVLFGCGSRTAYVCAGSEQCVLNGEQGVCEPQGFCSFPDPSCPGGRKFEPNAGESLGGTCVTIDAGPPDAATCGGVGQACCAAEPACAANAFCGGGSCQECATDVALGRHFSCALRYDHTVWCAGENGAGQLGNGLSGAPSAVWNQVHDSTSVAISDATAIGAGYEFACAVRTGGTVWCWGSGGSGQLGNKASSNSSAAVQVVLASGTPLANIAEVTGGYDHACARGTAGVWCWGSNSVGQLGDGTTTSRNVAAPVLDAPLGAMTTGAIALSTGGDNNCIRKTGDIAWCWGRNKAGELGDTTLLNRTTPVMIGPASSVSSGHRNTCTVHADGSVWCAGQTWRDRIGNGVAGYDSPVPASYPTAVQVLTAPDGPPLTGVDQVAVSGVSCVLMKDRTVQCWGDDLYGQTGTGAGSPVPQPVLLSDGAPLTDVDRLIVHFPHACVHRTTGEIDCWGRNLEGNAGDGTFGNHGLATPLRLTCP